jgi:hypothetical protein
VPSCGGRHLCTCDEELIHRDHRKPWESASAFGQIVWRAGPSHLTTGDIDHYAAVFGLNRHDLLRLIEHKQPDQPLKPMQEKTLLLLGAIIGHAIDCPDFVQPLDPRSGVFVVRGPIKAEPDGLRRTYFAGEQQVSKATAEGFVEVGTLADGEQIFRWLEGTRRPGPRRAQPLPPLAAP